VDPVVYNMLQEDPGKVDYSTIGGLAEQIRELRESIELPLLNPELFQRVGIKPPKGVLLYGPPGTGASLFSASPRAHPPWLLRMLLSPVPCASPMACRLRLRCKGHVLDFACLPVSGVPSRHAGRSEAVRSPADDKASVLFSSVQVRDLGLSMHLRAGAGKTLLARAIASNIDANFLKVVSSAIVDKYIGESARLIREMFGYAKARKLIGRHCGPTFWSGRLA
jgi:ATP-dependent 26S proteasome regulatory subunit